MWSFGGHIGSSVSALVDGQLDAESAERAWSHVLTCPPCRRMVEREGWVKGELATITGNEPSARLLGSLYDLNESSAPHRRPSIEAIEAWVAVDQIESKGRGRRRAGLAVVGAGSVSAAVLGIASLGGAGLGIGGTPAGTPATAFTRSTTAATPTHASPVNRPNPSPPWRQTQRNVLHMTNR